MITKYLSNKIQDYMFGKATYTPPATYYLGLSKTPISYEGTGLTEPSGNAYQRVPVTNNKTNWSTSTNGVIKNLIKVSFPESTGDWGVCTHVFIADASTGGNILFVSPLNVSRDIKIYSQLFFDINGLEFSLTSE